LRIIWDICAECHKPYVISVEPGEKAMLNPAAMQQQASKPF